MHSISVSRPEQLADALIEIQKLNPAAIYLSDGKGSRQIYPLKPDFEKRPIYYKRPSEPYKFLNFLPTNPEDYPIEVHYEDGTFTLIGLS